MADEQTRKEILKRLSAYYENAASALDFTNPFELLIATMLSAQSTDVQVNKATPALFMRYPTPRKLAAADIEDVERLVKSCGFYKTKAKNIVATAKILTEQYASEVPKDLDELTGMPGVGRKTASVVVSNAYDVPAIAVDTHVFRVSNRLGLAEAKDVYHTEMQLRANISKKDWKDAHHWILWHGRRFCKARKPLVRRLFFKGYLRVLSELKPRWRRTRISMFIDKARIYIKSGDGGDGCVSLHREKYVTAGGPDGGDGGNGGDIIFFADDNARTLLAFKYQKKYLAENGTKGNKMNQRGKDGESLMIGVPPGTVIKDADSGKVAADIRADSEKTLLKGGSRR